MYNVHLALSVSDYLNGIPDDEISRDGLDRLIAEFSQELGERADDFHRMYPTRHESLRFEYEIAFVELGSLHLFRLIVDMSHASFGVVTVVCIDRQRLHSPS